MYANGEGVPQDYAKAADLFKKAADQGYADAQDLLGLMYDNGLGVPQNHATAAEWYKKAAEQGNADAQFHLGNEYHIGQGVPQNHATAAEWYKKAAGQGNADAQFNLGVMYYNSEGVPQDYGKAADLFKKTADQGVGNAQFNLGIMYANGEGVPQDYGKAAEWFKKAADQGVAGAKEQLAKIDKLKTATNDKPQAQPQAQPQALDKTFTNSIGMEFVLIPAGEFPRAIGKNDFGEDIQSLVTISRPFYLGKYEVTQEQWVAVMGSGSNPSSFKGRTNPVERVSWDDVQVFIKKLNEKEGGQKYRLPTEAEWEHAARAGTKTLYFFGDDPEDLDSYAWYQDNTRTRGEREVVDAREVGNAYTLETETQTTWTGGSTHPVGGKKPNPWGLYDIYGNVWEWVSDWYGDYPAGSATDPTGPASGSDRVDRGGSWDDTAGDCRSAGRNGDTSDSRLRHYDLGFRLAFSPYAPASAEVAPPQAEPAAQAQAPTPSASSQTAPNDSAKNFFPSFDCAKASNPVEHAICADPVLAELDATLAARYKQALGATSNKEALKSTQRQWLKQRNGQCANAPDISQCLQRQYRERLSQF
jgi:formylglycine-generating enzyme required for sulfatase activity/uncharacterized protein YecT (DUF1311 family)